MRKLVRVERAFDLMNQGEVYEANVDEPRTKGLLASGYIVVVEHLEDALTPQPESELEEGTVKVGDSAPRSRRRGQVPA